MDRDRAMNGYRHARRESDVTVRNPLQRRLTQDSPASDSAVDPSALEWDLSVTNPAYAHMQHATPPQPPLPPLPPSTERSDPYGRTGGQADPHSREAPMAGMNADKRSRGGGGPTAAEVANKY